MHDQRNGVSAAYAAATAVPKLSPGMNGEAIGPTTNHARPGPLDPASKLDAPALDLVLDPSSAGALDLIVGEAGHAIASTASASFP